MTERIKAYQIQEKLINGQWTTLSHIACFDHALKMLEPFQRISLEGRVLVEKIKYRYGDLRWG